MWLGQGTEPGEGPPPPQFQDGGSLEDPGGNSAEQSTPTKVQFQQQQDQINQLKEFLKKNDQTLVSREKEVEKYATRLSAIKSRSKGSLRRTLTPKKDPAPTKGQGEEVGIPKSEETVSPESSIKDETTESNTKDETATPNSSMKAEILTPKSSSKKAQGNLVLLRKQLEENRAKFEQRGKELSENKKIEELVENLKLQIQELQKKTDSSQTSIPPKRTEGSENDPDLETKAPAIKEDKDKKINELLKKIMDLESKILDLQENLRGKESVLTSKTSALTLLSEDFSKKNKALVDNLEETKEEMRKMQNNFVVTESKLREEIEELKKEVTLKDTRVQQTEENNKELLSIRYDLSTRNAELQEKVVTFIDENKELKTRISELEQKSSQKVDIQDSAEVETIKKELNEAQKQITKMKAQYKNRVKNLNKQLESFKKMSDANEEIVKLQNRIAELEEDKGNLQLHLVDFDELKVSESHWQVRVSELEERVQQQSQDLDSHVHMIALLEAEKLDHMKGIQEEKEKIITQEAYIENLRTSLTEVESQKLSLEMKMVELEEQNDILHREKKEMQEEIDSFSHLPIKQVSEETSEKQNFISVHSQTISEDTECHVNSEDLKQLELELETARRIIDEQKAIISDLNFKIESRDEELELQQEMINKLECLTGEDQDKEEKITAIVKELNEMGSDLEEWKRRCNEVEKRLQDIGFEKEELEERFKVMKNENSLLKQQLADQKEVAEDLANKLRDQGNAIEDRDEKINSLHSMIQMNGQTLEAREITLKDVHEKLNNVEKEYESRLNELKAAITMKDENILNLSAELTAQHNILKEKESCIVELNADLNKQKQELISLKEHVISVENTAHMFEAQLGDMSRLIAEKDQWNSKLLEECESLKQHIQLLSSELLLHSQNSEKIEEERDKYKALEGKLKTSQENLKSQETELIKLKSDLSSARLEIEEKSDRLKLAETKLEEITEKNKKYIANLKAKTVAIKGHEQKLRQYEAVIEEKEKLILELTCVNESLSKNQSEASSLLSQQLQEQRERSEKLCYELNQEQSRTELIGEELASATERIVLLENQLKEYESKIETMSSIENKLLKLEKDWLSLQLELEERNTELCALKEEKSHMLQEGRKLEEEMRKEVEVKLQLEEKLNSLQEEIFKEIFSRQEEMDKVQSRIISKEKFDELMQQVKEKDLMVEQLKEELIVVGHRHSLSLSACEAKLQEREAFIECLEQELNKGKERIQSLEDRLSFVEERRQSLENKAEALNIRLQESDRAREEEVETEGMLEQRLGALISSEENLKKKVEALSLENEELVLKVAELEKAGVRSERELLNLELAMRNIQTEVERLSPFESSFGQASEKIGTLEAELKRVISEFDFRINEKTRYLQLQTESLESDLRNMSIQLEQAELEKRTLMEKYEKLNDEKLNLEDEIEGLNERLTSSKSSDEGLKLTKMQLEEKIGVLEAELQTKILALEEKEQLSFALDRKDVQELENQDPRGVGGSVNDEQITALTSELNTLKSVLSQKDNEIKSYQKRLLQLQFGNSPYDLEISDSQSGSSDKVSELEDSRNKLEETLKMKDAQINDISSVLNCTNTENDELKAKLLETSNKIDDLQREIAELEETLKTKEAEISSITALQNSGSEELKCKLWESNNKIEALEREISTFQDELRNRDNYIQQLQITSQNANNFPDEFSHIKNEYESQIWNLQQEKSQIYEELLHLKAQHEVSGIVQSAEEHVQKISVPDGSSPKYMSVELQESESERSMSLEPSSEDSKCLEGKIRDLEEELRLVRAERDDALLKLSQLAMKYSIPLESLPGVETEDTILLISAGMPKVDESNGDTPNEGIQGASLVTEEQSLETVSQLDPHAWDVGEEESWGWGTDEARLEEEHVQKQQHTLLLSEPASVLQKRIDDLEIYIKDIETEKAKLSEELHASQVRSGKMLKKLKDLKLKNESLMKENIEITKKKNEIDFGDLDQAIVEELKIQIDSLEKEVKELKNERDFVHAEKDGLLKRIDMLTAANERFVEMKEKQDIEIEVWRQKNKDLSNQLESLEWRLSELEANNVVGFEQQAGPVQKDSFFSWDNQTFSSTSADFGEITADDNKFKEQIMLLRNDNENLRILLEEQKNLRAGVESHLQELQQRLVEVNTEIELLATENVNLKNELDQLQRQSSVLKQGNGSELESQYEALKQDTINLECVHSTLNERYKQLCTENDEIRKKLGEMEEDYARKLDEIKNENVQMEEKCYNVQRERDMLSQELQELSACIAEVNKRNENLKSEYNAMKQHIVMQENSLVFADKEKLALEHELMQLKDAPNVTEPSSDHQIKLAELQKEVHIKNEAIENLRQLIENQKLEYAQNEHEWNNKVERLRKELEFYSENLLQQQDRHALLEKEHEELREHIEKIIQSRIEETINIKDQEIEFLKHQLADKNSQTSQLQDKLEDAEITREKLTELLHLLNVKDDNIKRLNEKLYEKETEFNETLCLKESDVTNLRTQLHDTKDKMNELLGLKDQDIENLKIQLCDKEVKINQLEQLLSEEQERVSELQKFLKDSEFHKEISQAEKGSAHNQGSHSVPQIDSDASSDSLLEKTSSTHSLKDSQDSSSDIQKELDIAHYMLHQRDVRCDELTLELMQLLEERDTLQLRLSNALRLNEEIRHLAKSSSKSSSPVKLVMTEDTAKSLSDLSRDVSPEHHVMTTIPLSSQSNTSLGESEEDLESLANKLSQLRTVGYQRDVTLQNDREQRHSEQVRLLHQRGRGIVVDANYTLSRDVQSPSTVLLNWIWGRSTPRVMHV